MKKISVLLSLSAIAVSFVLFTGCHSANGSSSAADSNFEGVVSYKIQPVAGLPPEVSAMLDSMKMKTYVKGGLSRTEESMAGNENIVIGDSKKPEDPIMLISMFNHKYAVRRNDSMKKLEASNIPKIEYIDSASATKNIAGYACNKAKITINSPKDGSLTSYVYYTTDLPYADPQGQFKGLKGMPMEFTVSMSGLSITISAKSVEKKSLPDSLFTIPAAFKEVSLDELQKELSSSMAAAAADTTASGSKQ